MRVSEGCGVWGVGPPPLVSPAPLARSPFQTQRAVSPEMDAACICMLHTPRERCNLRSLCPLPLSHSTHVGVDICCMTCPTVLGERQEVWAATDLASTHNLFDGQTLFILPDSGWLADSSQVDMLGARCKFVNLANMSTFANPPTPGRTRVRTFQIVAPK